MTHKTFEAIQYYLLKASNELAIEQGACPWFNETTYAQGVLPIDTYKRSRCHRQRAAALQLGSAARVH
ncbi:hypothetical protein DMH27_10630 [Raoultella planticola]|nr:hypothetical protein [Raoultella planticola]